MFTDFPVCQSVNSQQTLRLCNDKSVFTLFVTAFWLYVRGLEFVGLMLSAIGS